MRERGAISLVGAAIVVATAVVAMALGHLGADAVRRGRVSSVAEAVALAAAVDPAAGAAIAAANKTELLSVTRDGFQVEVEVRRYGVQAVSRAEFLPPNWWLCQTLPSDHPVHSEMCLSTPTG